MSVLSTVKGPYIDWAGLSPLVALLGGAVVVLLVGLLRSRVVRERIVPALSVIAFAAAAGLAVWQWDREGSILSGTLAIDPLAMVATIGVSVMGIGVVLLSYGASAPREAAHGEYHFLLLVSAAGMALIAGAQNLIVTFLALELLSVPLYVLAATELHRRRSLEAGLKYLVIGSVGSATMLYGFALIFGATGHTGYDRIAATISAQGLGSDGLLLGGVAMAIVGFAFKSSLAPFHQWTPDVYEGAPTVVTTLMATATKIGALIAMLRFFDVAVIGAAGAWQPILAAIAAIAMIVGNVGALGQSSLKRLLAFSSVGQAGYMLVGVVVGTQLGAEALVFYVLAYVVMTLAAFAVVTAVEREAGHDRRTAFDGLGRRRPVYAVVLTASFLGLAGIPGTVGFVAKLRVVQAAVDGHFAWLAIVLVVGSMVSLGYYLRVIARLWAQEPAADAVLASSARRGRPARAALAGADPAAEDRDPGGDGLEVPQALAETGQPVVAVATEQGGDEPVMLGRPPLPTGFVAVVAGAAVIVLGVIPGPLMHAVEAVVRAVPGLF